MEDALTAFREGPDELDAALVGLAEADLDRVGGADNWTIREIVHHLAEADMRQITFTRIALLSSGHPFEFSWHPGNRAMAAALHYAHLPVAPSLALFRANREHFSQMLTRVLGQAPSAWDQYLVVKATPEEAGAKVTVGEWITGMTDHLREHLGEISSIRQELSSQPADS